MTQQTLDVRGMTCEHCVSAVKNSVGALDGIEQVEVNLGNGKVVVDFNDSKTTIEAIKDAVEGQGYEVVPANN